VCEFWGTDIWECSKSPAKTASSEGGDIDLCVTRPIGRAEWKEPPPLREEYVNCVGITDV
jgi:hypothetical protein